MFYVGNVEYESLVDAFEAANETGNVTIDITKNIDFSDSEYADYYWAGSTYNPLEIKANNVVIDLHGHSFYNMGNTAICIGNDLAVEERISGCVIKNGTLLAGKTNNITNSYVLGISNADDVLVENLTTNGGINVYTQSNDIVINNCTINGTKFYSVCSQRGSHVTITGNTFITKNTDSTTSTKAMFWIDKAGTGEEDLITDQNPNGEYEASSITLESGSYTVDFAHSGIFFNTGGLKPTVQGGTFNFNPRDCLDEGYVVEYIGDNAWRVVPAASATAQYYLVGTFNKWNYGTRDVQYLLTVDPNDSNHYSIELTTTAVNQELKVIDNFGNYFGGVNGANVTIGETGTYVVNLYVDADVHVQTEPYYYLVGKLQGEDHWAIDPVESPRFVKNPSNPSEYTLDITLNSSDEFKVRNSTADHDWYPAEGGNYYVQNAGEYTIYFSPTWRSDWGGHFYLSAKMIASGGSEPVQGDPGLDD